MMRHLPTGCLEAGPEFKDGSLGFGVWGLGFRVQGWARVYGLGFRVQGLGVGVQGLAFRV